MADDQGTKVSKQDQASASGPKNPEPQDNGSETAAASSVPTPKEAPKEAPKDEGSEDEGSDSSDSGRGAGLHR